MQGNLAFIYIRWSQPRTPVGLASHSDTVLISHGAGWLMAGATLSFRFKDPTFRSE